MGSTRPTIRSILAPTAAKAVTVVATGAVAAALSLTATAGAATGGAATGGAHARSAAASSFSFALKPSSAAISACLPKPGGHVTVTPGKLNDPNVPFNLGCEPGATPPIVTPFNGEQHAGIQVVNTAQFPVSAGPLSHVHR